MVNNQIFYAAKMALCLVAFQSPRGHVAALGGIIYHQIPDTIDGIHSISLMYGDASYCITNSTVTIACTICLLQLAEDFNFQFLKLCDIIH